jgi:imidazolonepropionase
VSDTPLEGASRAPSHPAGRAPSDAPLTLWTHACVAPMVPTEGALIRGAIRGAMQAPDAPLGSNNAWGLLPDGAVVTAGEQIMWVGDRTQVPERFPVQDTVDLGGRLLMPGWIDAHTHLVYAGDRSGEHARRLEGVSYETIAAEGGGIRATMRATRAGSRETLLASAMERAQTLMRGGVTTVEIKSGYGLTLEDERRALQVARAVGEHLPLSVLTTFLPLHALPPEFAEARVGAAEGAGLREAGEPVRAGAAAYVDAACAWLETLHAEGLVDAVDAFVETVAFTVAEAERFFEHARGLGIPLKIHAEQRSSLGGARMAASLGALSCDHVEYLDEDGIRAMAKAGSVAVLLPGAWYLLRESERPPVARLRAAGVPMALATDHNPGTSPTLSLQLMVHMGATFFGLSPLEALEGVTRNAARALGLSDRGVLAPGTRADFSIWNVEHPASLVHAFGHNLCAGVVVGGVRVP